MAVTDTWGRLKQLLELVRISHTLFALPFALLAALMAWTLGAAERPPLRWRWQELAGIVVCMVAARTVAMAVNRVADARLDGLNPRTAGRHIPTGRLSATSVVLLGVVAAAVFLAGTLLFLPNRLPFYLAFPVLVFLVGYSFSKRFTSGSHFYLGAALMLAPVASWIAIRGPQVITQPTDLMPAMVLGAAVLLWVAGFDMIYACQDTQFDRSVGLRSVPARWGVPGALRAAAACHVGTVLMLALLPLCYPFFGAIYWSGIVALAGVLAYQHAIVRPDDLSRVNLAFFHVNAVFSIGLLLLGAVDLLL
jgi:4-hydroxybenzoate polyprenyltransferase